MWRCSTLLHKGSLTALLRDVIRCTQPCGIPLGDVEIKAKEHFLSLSNGEQEEFPLALKKALLEANDAHYIDGAKLYPCNWERVVQSIAVEMPCEGLTEKGLVDRILEFEPRFNMESASLGEPLSEWMARRFPHIILVSRSASTGVPVYRPVRGKLPEEVECIANALQLLGREKLPVYTDFALIAPLLPATVCPTRGNWVAFLERGSVQCHFDLDVDVHIRLSPNSIPSTVCVDGTTVELARVNEVLAANGLSDSTCSLKVFRRAEDPVWSQDDIVLPSFLEPEHAIGAAIASLGARSCMRIYILCGDSAVERYKTGLLDLLRSAETDVRIFTPCNAGFTDGAISSGVDRREKTVGKS
ncbi:uncharacterized protein TEOVI_000397700 [Trypanosoma equiperdum]|uniref:Uncharacterized protein n=4 Tax=Trypanozoon TaxID=39700 RepID=Q38C69_TRYB2|nr:hypothetical protein, conserved [Trypanosoma brucei gambiense DAL972]XP_822429.1 hypothetical protein, conserved [Trypanosoma brucei brucei TREU927]RHW68590.1 hypothetical protein DPX39_100022300 [Trypanosoma brucei equiperdum]SCU72401.1 hypothetical protein, conserved [Trypanosoma equiperdum]EAN77601.1 hypothetical protein, conserved [Trypanosoma brucei brucei TREU927]CBH15124.1 hypothetical protein, conserved [Trypanosoma brucei gambiense DAL972]|eukprot:XP_011777390.1 hypothetical protein, conserved [Trypanosoma brucei gambiense DAL972]